MHVDETAMEHLTGALGHKCSKDAMPLTALGLDYPHAIDSLTKLEDYQTVDIALIWRNSVIK